MARTSATEEPAGGGASTSPERVSADSSTGGFDKPIVRIRHVERGVLAGVVALALLALVVSLARNPNISWPVVGEYLFNESILSGLLTTLEMSVLAMAVAIVLAVVVAMMRVSESRIISSIAGLYIFFFRGIPLMVQVIFWGNIGLFVKTITIGIPLTGIDLYSHPTKDLVTPFVASVAALAFAESAYMAEIVRSGLLSVDRGQRQAAKALGLRQRQTLRLIVVPQALRVIVPPTGNQLIGMLKATAIVSVIAGGDLLTTAQNISGLNYRTIELLVVATIWYLVVIVIMSIGQAFVERRVAEK
jgi:polar amino acid transport system permease protein